MLVDLKESMCVIETYLLVVESMAVESGKETVRIL